MKEKLTIIFLVLLQCRVNTPCQDLIFLITFGDFYNSKSRSNIVLV